MKTFLVPKKKIVVPRDLEQIFLSGLPSNAHRASGRSPSYSSPAITARRLDRPHRVSPHAPSRRCSPSPSRRPPITGCHHGLLSTGLTRSRWSEGDRERLSHPANTGREDDIFQPCRSLVQNSSTVFSDLLILLKNACALVSFMQLGIYIKSTQLIFICELDSVHLGLV